MSSKKESTTAPPENDFLRGILDLRTQIDALIKIEEKRLTEKDLDAKANASATLLAKAPYTIQELRLRPTLYAGRIDPDEIQLYYEMHTNIPAVISHLQVTMEALDALRQNSGKRLSAIVRKTYRLVKADAVDMKELVPFRDNLAEMFAKIGETVKANNKAKAESDSNAKAKALKSALPPTTDNPQE